MNIDQQLVSLMLGVWTSEVRRATKSFSAMPDEQLLREVRPGRNRLIYLLGHLTAVSDALFPLFGFRELYYPELSEAFLTSPDHSPVQDAFSAGDLKHRWSAVNQALLLSLEELSPLEWLGKHTAVSDEDFKREPHRNRMSVLLRRTNHLSYHLGQLSLATKG